MMAGKIKTRKDCRSRLSGFNEINGRHEETRTPDLYRVNFEVTNPKPFPYLAFPHSIDLETAQKWSSFDGELMASFCRPCLPALCGKISPACCHRRSKSSLNLPTNRS